MLVTVGGLATELALLEHYEHPMQWAPLITLALTATTTVWVWARPGRRAVRVFQGVMVLCLVVALVGMVLHYDANATLEIELNAEMEGRDLVWRALRGGVPALAPGAILQMGLLGLIAVWRHPATTASPSPENR